MPPVFHATAGQGICKWLLMREAPRAALAEPFCKPSEFLTRTAAPCGVAPNGHPHSKIGVSVLFVWVYRDFYARKRGMSASPRFHIYCSICVGMSDLR